MTCFISDRMCAEVVAAGDGPERQLRHCVDLTTACIAARRPDTAVGTQVCRGNSRSGRIAEGGDQHIADAMPGSHADDLIRRITEEDQWRKPERVVEVAQTVWCDVQG